LKGNPKYYVYLITNLLTDKQYVGSRTCYVDPKSDDYFGSSNFLWNDINELGRANFSKEILDDNYKNYNDLLEGETFYILKHNTLAPNGYNRFLPNVRKSFNTTGISVYEIWLLKFGRKEADKKYKLWKKRESESQSGSKNSFYNKKHSEKTKEQISKKQKERLKNGDYSEAHRKAGQTIKERGSLKGHKNGMFGKMWITNPKTKINKIITKNQLEKYLENGWAKGFYTSNEIKEKQRKSQLNRNYKISEETRKKLSKKSSGKNNGMFGRVWVYNENLIANKSIKKLELISYLDTGWKKGMKRWKNIKD